MAGININLEITEEMLKKASANDTKDEIWGLVNDYVCTMRRNMEIANNTYTLMGYEIALDVLKSMLEERGYKFDDIFPDENEDIW